jgi:hypothetical protein
VNLRYGRPEEGDVVAEDDLPDPNEEEELDDSDVSLTDILSATHREEPPTQCRGRITKHEKGGLMMIADAENLDELLMVEEKEVEGEGRGKQKKTANRLYSLTDFARHWDNENSDVD